LNFFDWHLTHPDQWMVIEFFRSPKRPWGGWLFVQKLYYMPPPPHLFGNQKNLVVI
jgi:hypothetical protein